MKYYIFDFYPFEIKKLKQLNRNTKEYKREFKKFMVVTQHFPWVGGLVHDKENPKFKEKYLNCLRPCILFLIFFIFWLVYGIYVSSQWEETKYILPNELRLFIIWLVVWIVLFTISMIFALKAGKIIYDYVSFSIDNYVMRKHNLTDEELSLVIEAFKNPHKQYDDSYCAISAGCLDCLEMFDAKRFTVGNYHSYECPHCKSNRLICKTENDRFELNKKLLMLIKDYWE